MDDKKVVMRVQKPNERIHNFKEVELGYNEEEAMKEASRCLNCQNPRCVKGCPVGIMIPKFIEALKNNKIESSFVEIVPCSMTSSMVINDYRPIPSSEKQRIIDKINKFSINFIYENDK